MTSGEVRNTFLEYFKGKQHEVIQSAPIVVKNDPTLMFTNAGMNQFKDYFLGHKPAPNSRLADTQKCLRVSGKHNDLEEVGVDTYHHTMFEMLGNWSFGDYFKSETIMWAWELLTDVFKLDKDRLYVTVFEGDESDGLSPDTESEDIWKKHIAADRIIRCDKKDNFWEMGETGPCGSCSEIHMDLRPDSERNETDGKSLVNADHPQVIELWNLVFMEFNRKADGSLENLPHKHVDTGMGLERIVRAVQLKNSNYDTDLFQVTINELTILSGKQYGENETTDIAFRVISDHIRALTFCVADGQIPSNNGAGYVIRRILRRAVRYGYSFLGFDKPFLNKLVHGLAERFKDVFPELHSQKDFVQNIIQAEETSFLRTLFSGMDRLKLIFDEKELKEIDGKTAFELYDTFGFPLDLTRLIASERRITLDETGFEQELNAQKKRSKADAAKSTGDWTVLADDAVQEFIGYDHLESEVVIARYRTIKVKEKTSYQLVFNITPFYGESGGQVGDTGSITGADDKEIVQVKDTQKENDLIVHIVDGLPENPNQPFTAMVDAKRRTDINKNHSATHLMHSALREVLGKHVAQKGSLVDQEKLRFDFSHFQKPTEDELAKIEQRVNEKIREAIPLWEERTMPYAEAIAKGVTALFGEKYGDVVRVVVFDEEYSMELCGGTHVANTGEISGFKVLAESSVAAGVRRIEAITGDKLTAYYQTKIELLDTIAQRLDHPADLLKHLDQLLLNNSKLNDRIKVYESEKFEEIKQYLSARVTAKDGINVIIERISALNPARIKDLAFQLRQSFDSLFLVLASDFENKPGITIIISDNLVKERGWQAGLMVRDWGKAIKGGGGGQAFFAQAGGVDVGGLDDVLQMAHNFLNP
jgi:alanyl-tRNA synthetase